MRLVLRKMAIEPIVATRTIPTAAIPKSGLQKQIDCESREGDLWIRADIFFPIRSHAAREVAQIRADWQSGQSAICLDGIV